MKYIQSIQQIETSPLRPIKWTKILLFEAFCSQSDSRKESIDSVDFTGHDKAPSNSIGNTRGEVKDISKKEGSADDKALPEKETDDSLVNGSKYQMKNVGNYSIPKWPELPDEILNICIRNNYESK